MKHELLVPVGNYESLIQAINNGADAVYLGGKRFGARAYADNFTLEEIENATRLCHLYSVKIYITVNTLIFESEFNDAVDYIRELHKIGVDAIIMQDVGLINVVHKKFPNLEIHASTQMHSHNKYAYEFLKELGVKRIVFAREMSLDEIENVDNSLEKEVFIHGALCISYSGQCLFSSSILGRSGNRGECAGMCRLPYELYEDDKKINTKGEYLLSPKDLCTIPEFKRLLDSNILSFKIEGRMKSPEYVGMVTKIYRNLIDQYENNLELEVDKEDYFYLQALFNREYTTGHLFADTNIMNSYKPNHQGVLVGKVTNVTKKKIEVKLLHSLKQHEGIRFKNKDTGFIINYMYDKKDNLINKGNKNDYIYLDNTIDLKEFDEVYLTNPLLNLDNEITKKIPINIEFKANVNDYAYIKAFDGENVVEVKSKNICEKSITSPLPNETVLRSLNKCGNTAFNVTNVNIDISDSVFMPVSLLNELRRESLEKLENIRKNKKVGFNEVPFEEDNFKQTITNELSVLVRTKEQLQACLDLNVKNIITNKPYLITDNIIYKIPKDIKSLDNLNKNKKYLVTDYASLKNFNDCIADYSLNITNHYTLNYFSKYNTMSMLSVECNMSNIKDIMDNTKNKNVEILVYGNIELMVMKYCPINEFINKDKICNVCHNNKKYYLKDRNKVMYTLENNPFNHSTIILNHKKTDLIDKISEFKNIGVTNYRIELLDENYNETKELIERVRKYE